MRGPGKGGHVVKLKNKQRTTTKPSDVYNTWSVALLSCTEKSKKAE